MVDDSSLHRWGEVRVSASIEMSGIPGQKMVKCQNSGAEMVKCQNSGAEYGQMSGFRGGIWSNVRIPGRKCRNSGAEKQLNERIPGGNVTIEGGEKPVKKETERRVACGLV